MSSKNLSWAWLLPAALVGTAATAAAILVSGSKPQTEPAGGTRATSAEPTSLLPEIAWFGGPSHRELG